MEPSYESPLPSRTVLPYRRILGDIVNSSAENASWTFWEPFRYTIPGNFSTDGKVDAGDYAI